MNYNTAQQNTQYTQKDVNRLTKIDSLTWQKSVKTCKSNLTWGQIYKKILEKS